MGIMQATGMANDHITECFEAFLFSWSEDKSYDVLLLDIQMPGQFHKTNQFMEVYMITLKLVL